MELDIKITQFEVEIKPVIRSDAIKAFVTWYFITSEGKWKITGGTIKKKPFGKNKVEKLTFDGAAFKAGQTYFKVLFIDNVALYKSLCDFTIEKYAKKTGELVDVAFGEDIDPADIQL